MNKIRLNKGARRLLSKGGVMVFTKDTKIREITQHPSFRGFGHCPRCD